VLRCRLARAGSKVPQTAAAQSTSGASQELQQPHQQTTFHHGITYVSYEGNSFWVKFNNSGQHRQLLLNPSRPSLCKQQQQQQQQQQQLIGGMMHDFNFVLAAPASFSVHHVCHVHAM
jgi:hypothetical protein